MYLCYKIVLLLCYIVIVVIQKIALLCTLCCLVIRFFFFFFFFINFSTSAPLYPSKYDVCHVLQKLGHINPKGFSPPCGTDAFFSLTQDCYIRKWTMMVMISSYSCFTVLQLNCVMSVLVLHLWMCWFCTAIKSLKSQISNITVPYPALHHFGTNIWTFLFKGGALLDLGQVNC